MKNIIRVCFVCITLHIAADISPAFEFEDVLNRVNIHGFISQGFLQSEGNNFYAGTEDGTLQFNEVGVNVSKELTDRLHTSLQLLSRDIGDIGNNEVQLDLAYADYRWKDWLGLRVGKVKINYGLYNETRDIDMLRTSILLPQNIYPEALRDVYHSLYGVEIYGNFSLGWAGNLNYQIQSGQKDIEAESGMAKFLEGDVLTPGVDIQRFEMRDMTTFSLDWDTFLDGLRLKLWSGSYKLEALLENKIELPGEEEVIPAGTAFRAQFEDRWRSILSLEYATDRFVLVTEIQSEGTEQTVTGSLYAGGTWNVTDWWQIGGYYAEKYPTEDLDLEEEDLEREDDASCPDSTEMVITTRFDIHEQWTLKIEGHVVEGTSMFFTRDNPDELEDESMLFAVKTTFHF